MGALHFVDALRMDATQLEGKSAFQIGMKEQMKHRGHSSKRKSEPQEKINDE